MNEIVDKLGVVGWREYVSLPDMAIDSIKAKVDTGARSSSLHAFEIEEFTREGQRWVRFNVHPRQKDDLCAIAVEAPVLDVRNIRSSSGEVSERYVIVTALRLLGQTWPIELTLANRDEMGFRMLLGREAVRGRMLVDAGTSYYSGKPQRKQRRARPPVEGDRSGKDAP